MSAILLWFSFSNMALANIDSQPSSIHGDPLYADVNRQLQILVDIEGTHNVNHFCVVAYHDPDYQHANVYWPTQHSLLLWDPDNMLLNLIFSRRFWNLLTDVVRNENYLDGSTYLLARADLDEIRFDCRRFGNSFVVYKTKDHWVPIKNYEVFSSVRFELQTLVDAEAKGTENKFLCHWTGSRVVCFSLRVLEGRGASVSMDSRGFVPGTSWRSTVPL